jgi:hypothetical protein
MARKAYSVAKEQYFMDEFRKFSWDYVTNSLKIFGWDIETNDDKMKVFVKKSLRMIVLGMNKNKWEVKIFRNRKLVDGLGINSDTETKILVTQNGVLWGMAA